MDPSIAAPYKASRARLQAEAEESALVGEGLLVHLRQPGRHARLELVCPNAKLEVSTLAALQGHVGADLLMDRLRPKLPTAKTPSSLDELTAEIDAIAKATFVAHLGKATQSLIDAIVSVASRMKGGKAPQWSKTTSDAHLSEVVASLEWTCSCVEKGEGGELRTQHGAQAVNTLAAQYIASAVRESGGGVTLDGVTKLRGYMHVMDHVLHKEFLAVRAQLLQGSTAPALDTAPKVQKRKSSTPASSSSLKKQATITDYDHAMSLIS